METRHFLIVKLLVVLNLLLLSIGVSAQAATINNAPTASNVSTLAVKNTSREITLIATDVDKDPLVFIPVNTSKNGGTVKLKNGNVVIYTPKKDYVGADSFTFTVKDSKNVISNTATVQITSVKATNTPPVANAGVDQVVNKKDIVSLDGSSSTDTDGHISSYIWKQIAGATVSLSAEKSAKPMFTAPAVKEKTVLKFELTVTDNNGTQTKRSTNVTVKAFNTLPIAKAQSKSLTEDSSLDIKLVATDIDNDKLTYKLVSQPSHGRVTLNGTVATYRPIDNYNGQDSFTFTANDGLADAVSAKVKLTITPINDVPVALAGNALVFKNIAQDITLSANDIEGDALTYLPVKTSKQGGAVKLKSGNLVTYTPKKDYVGTDSFTFTVTDSSKTKSKAATVTINVDKRTPPTANAGISQTVGERELVSLDASNSNAPNGSIVSYSWEQIKGRSAYLSSYTSVNPSFIAPDIDKNELLTFKLTIKDNTGLTATSNVNVTVENCLMPDPKDNNGFPIAGLSCKDKAMFNYFKLRIVPQLDGNINEAVEQTKVIEENLSDENINDIVDQTPIVSGLETLESALDVVDSVIAGDFAKAFTQATLTYQKGMITYVNQLVVLDSNNLNNQKKADMIHDLTDVTIKLNELLLNELSCVGDGTLASIKSDKCVNAIIKMLDLANKNSKNGNIFNLDKNLIRNNLKFLNSGLSLINKVKSFNIKNISKAKINRAFAGIASGGTKMLGDGLIAIYGDDKMQRPFVLNLMLQLNESVFTPYLETRSSCLSIDRRSALTDRVKCYSDAAKYGGKILVKGYAAFFGTGLTVRYVTKINENIVAKKVLERMLSIGAAKRKDIYKTEDYYYPSTDFIVKIGDELDWYGYKGYKDFSIALDPVALINLGTGDLYSIAEVSLLTRLYYAEILNNANFNFNTDAITLAATPSEPGLAKLAVTVTSSLNGKLVCSPSTAEGLELLSLDKKLLDKPWLVNVSKNKTISSSLFIKYQKGKGSVMCNLYTANGAFMGAKTIAITGKGYDEDGDGIPYSWEKKYGLNPDNPADALLDKDGDQLSNLDEFKAGTKPDVKDSDKDGFSDWQEVEAGTSPVIPEDKPLSAPTNLQAIAGDGKISLSWTAVQGVDRYVICGSSATGSMLDKQRYGCLYGERFIYRDVAGSTTNHTIDGLENGTTYYFLVVAYDSKGKQSPVSNEVSAIPKSILPTPMNVKANAGDSKVSLSWDAVLGAEAYNVCYATVSIANVDNCTAYTNGKWATSQTPNITISNLMNGKNYYFRVVALAGLKDKSTPSSEIFVRPNKVDLKTGLVAHWSFDDCTAKDVSGNGHDGSVVDTVCENGINVGHAFRFNGFSSYVSTYLPTVNKTYSVSMFAKFNSNDNIENQLFYLTRDGFSDRLGYLSTWPIGGKSWHWGSMGVTGAYPNDLNQWSARSSAFDDESGLVNNIWSHLVFVLNDTDIALYVNGKLLKNISSPYHSDIENNTDLLFMLGATTEGYQHMDGVIDELYFYNRALSESEVKALYQLGGGVAGATGKLNDTGITTCANDTENNLACPVTDLPNQDAQSGRDVTANDDSDGHAGFSFTKISSTGAALPASATEWSCVKDNVTGLMWEVKTDDGGLHDKDWTYSWYEPDNTKNGGFAGYLQSGDFGSGSFSYTNDQCAGYVADDSSTYCNSKVYVERVNHSTWCGYANWRLPTVDELRGLVSFDRVNPSIDSSWFPDISTNGLSSNFLSSSVSPNPQSFEPLSVSFDLGHDSIGSLGGIRLVRSENYIRD